MAWRARAGAAPTASAFPQAPSNGVDSVSARHRRLRLWDCIKRSVSAASRTTDGNGVAGC
jgi:hypothetical protein